MVYVAVGFIFGLLIPYMSRRFAKFMPATPAYAIYRLIKPNKIAKKAQNNLKYTNLRKKYLIRSLVYAVILALLALLLVLGFDSHIGWYLSFVCVLVLLTEIDIKMFLLPDILTIPLIISGFVFAVFCNESIGAPESAMGAAIGYVLPVIATLLMLWRSTDAFGGGDIKLLAAIGAWLGFEGVVYTILLSCIVFGVYSIIKGQKSGAFGPSLAVSAVVVLLCVYGF